MHKYENTIGRVVLALALGLLDTALRVVIPLGFVWVTFPPQDTQGAWSVVTSVTIGALIVVLVTHHWNRIKTAEKS